MSESPAVRLWPDPNALATITDLYQLTMIAGYAGRKMDQLPATFETFVRKLAPNRGYMIFAGLEQAIGDLLELRFSDEQIAYLRDLPAFAAIDTAWFDKLREFRFTGDVWSVPEGTAVFPNEPLVRIEAPLAEAQLAETFLLASLSYPTMAATKAARVIEAAKGRGAVDFGARRGHGPHAGFLCARAAYIAGFSGTSHVEAARRLGIPAVGTMAHAWVQSFADEREAFAAFAQQFPNSTTLLVDTYDTLRGVERAAAIEPPVQGIRIDSGDFANLAIKARALLDARGRSQTKILVSGDMDEYKIDHLLSQGAPIDAFGVGTELITSGDAPALSMVYKLVELDGRGATKLAVGKKSYPYGKQVHRFRDPDGQFVRDLVTKREEVVSGANPLLRQVVAQGIMAAPWPSLDQIREHCRRERESLPEQLRGIRAQSATVVGYSDFLEAETERFFQARGNPN